MVNFCTVQRNSHFKKNICMYFLFGKTFPLFSNKLFLYLYCEQCIGYWGITLWFPGFPLPSSSCQVRSYDFCFPHPSCFFFQWYSSILRSVLFKNKCFTEWQGICYLLTAHRQGIELLITFIFVETTSLYFQFCFLPLFPHEEPQISLAVICFIEIW